MIRIKEGTVFNTAFEVGCVALSEPDDMGEFDGRDSDGVVCNFHTAMVEGHADEIEPIVRPARRKGE